MKATQRNFDYFKKRCEYWLAKFGLNGWKIRYEFKSIGANANMIANGNKHIVTIGLDTEIDFDEFIKTMTLEEYLDELAKHECLHVLLARYTNIAEARYCNEEEIVAAEEEIVIKLIGLII